ncbi:hypothetical protein [Granulicella sp. L60]|uniref:hypothetical protein n=1 Tax=Granulicella sp. L60 TaxID=1641866 RepID=UPI00131D421B|nr:hypothetical protein [Granulicella sp. L60]
MRNAINVVVHEAPCHDRPYSVKSRLPGSIVQVSLWLMFFIWAVCSSAWASDVLLMTKTGSNATLEDQVGHVSRFYGLGTQIISIDAPIDSLSAIYALKQPDVLAAIISTDALENLDRATIFDALQRANGFRIPLLIVATGPRSTSPVLSIWSGGRIDGCKAVESHTSEWRMMFAKEVDVLQQLAGFVPKSTTSPSCGLVLSHDKSVRALAEMWNGNEKISSFVDFSINGQPVFVVTAMGSINKVEQSGTTSLQESFSSMAGLLVFLRYAAGERAWHMPAHYANLTVDDPWLTDPYGNLGYRALLHEMKEHNFHTTIAFVPWNFDRSNLDVVSLFHNHADLFSICIHGNNHNHREFGEYSAQPLNRQRDNIEQALARMEQFKKATGLPYDRVMVFPHAVAPAGTFETLKKSNYWATVNSENVPLGSIAPDDPLFPLSSWTLTFKGFPSVKRISAEVPISNTNIAINAFLGNPQLFYVHQEFFEDRIDAFDATADEINRLEPAVQWKSLGYIVRHLYLTRLRLDQDYDVLAISSNLELMNLTERRVVFHVHKPEDPTIPLRSVVVNGVPASYQATSNEIRFDVVLEPKQSRDVEISYSEGLTLASVDISKRSLLVALDRRLSDFRDMVLSRSMLGRKIQFAYYKYRFDRIERLIERSITIFFLVIAGLLLSRMVISLRKRDMSTVEK